MRIQAANSRCELVFIEKIDSQLEAVLSAELTRAPDTYNPRACDCDFCQMHGAVYVSDAQGALVIQLENERATARYRQGSGQAEFLGCRNCGVLVGALYGYDGLLHAAVNVRALDVRAHFGSAQIASPKALSDDEKSQRWRDLWFSNVSIVAVGKSATE